jgi:hypothetical protein
VICKIAATGVVSSTAGDVEVDLSDLRATPFVMVSLLRPGQKLVIDQPQSLRNSIRSRISTGDLVAINLRSLRICVSLGVSAMVKRQPVVLFGFGVQVSINPILIGVVIG